MLRWQEGEAPHGRAGLDHASDCFKGHGRIERRQLLAMSVSPARVGWPGARQVVLLRRERRIGLQAPTIEFHCGITSLRRRDADAAALLRHIRGHWGIENRLFHVRDVTLGEDACRVRSGHAPQNLAALRNLALTLISAAGWINKAAALRRHAAHPHEALALIKASPPEN
jgi:hypothetical protein